MFFDENFFNGEYRNGFYVSPLMKRTWAAEMEILSTFDSISRMYGIRYYAACGTLLGAVRHHGYIPWDDDIDLWLFREDIHKLSKIPSEAFANFGLTLYSPTMHANYQNTVYHLSNGTDINISEEFLRRFHGCPFHLGIDLIPLDYIPVNSDEEHIQDDLYTEACLLGFDWEDMKEELRMEKYADLVNRIGGFDPVGWELPQRLFVIADSLSQLYNDDKDGVVASIPFKIEEQRRRFHPDWFGEPVYLDFENMKLPAPMEYDLVLKAEIGEDYMTPKQVYTAHDYPFYKEQYNELLCLFERNSLPVPEIYKEL